MKILLTWLPDNGAEETVTVHNVDGTQLAAIRAAVNTDDPGPILMLPDVEWGDGTRREGMFRAWRVRSCEVVA